MLKLFNEKIELKWSTSIVQKYFDAAEEVQKIKIYIFKSIFMWVLKMFTQYSTVYTHTHTVNTHTHTHGQHPHTHTQCRHTFFTGNAVCFAGKEQ